MLTGSVFHGRRARLLHHNGAAAPLHVWLDARLAAALEAGLRQEEPEPRDPGQGERVEGG